MVAPLAGVLLLVAQALGDGAEALLIDVGAHLLPSVHIAVHLLHAAVIVHLQTLPERLSVGHDERPGQMVEPQQILFGAGLHIVKHFLIRTAILLRGTRAAVGAAVEADALLVGLVIPHGLPLVREVGLVALGLRTVVVVALEDMVQAQWHHVVHTGLAAAFHHIGHRAHEAVVAGEGLLQPLAGNVARREVGVPRQTAEDVPVGLREMVTAPVLVQSDVGHAGGPPQFSPCGKCTFRSPLLLEGIGRALEAIEELRPHGAEVDQMAALPEIFLRNLQLGHHRRLLQLVEERAVGLARLEVERAVLDLYDDVLAELPVEGLELVDGLHHAVGVALVIAIDEGAPHDDATVGSHCVGQHVGTLGVRALVVARAGLALAVGLDEEAAEVGN